MCIKPANFSYCMHCMYPLSYVAPVRYSHEPGLKCTGEIFRSPENIFTITKIPSFGKLQLLRFSSK